MSRMSLNKLVLTSVAWLLWPSHAVAGEWAFPSADALKDKPTGELVLNAGTHQTQPADFGIMNVPENRSNANARAIQLHVVRMHTKEEPAGVPIFNLVGGSGISNVWGVEIPPLFYARNPVVKVGYRGVDSKPDLKCLETGGAFVVDRPLSPAGLRHIRKKLRERFDRFIADGFDLNGYTILEVVDDIEDVRKALGYEKINLLSTSYGSLVAYVYCVRYPQRVHRNLMIGAGNIARHIVWEPDTLDRQLREYGELWKKDTEAVARAPDIIDTMQKVLKSLPPAWRNLPLDPDKIRIATFYMLYETQNAALVLDAFAAAGRGEYAGLAMLHRGYDGDVRAKEYWCDFLCKALSAGLDQTRDYEREMDPPGSILGSPLSKLLWGAASHGGWPIKPIPEEYTKLQPILPRTLILNGGLDVSGPPEYVKELAPYLKDGEIVIIPNMGHMDVIKLQRNAFRHLVRRFFDEGAVDASKYQPREIDFSPRPNIVDFAKMMVPEVSADN